MVSIYGDVWIASAEAQKPHYQWLQPYTPMTDSHRRWDKIKEVGRDLVHSVLVGVSRFLSAFALSVALQSADEEVGCDLVAPTRCGQAG